MKKILLSIAILAFVTGCSNNKPEEHNHGTHKHDDGTMHEHHDDGNHHQEEFNVEPDSTVHHEEGQEHNHDEGYHNHSH